MQNCLHAPSVDQCEVFIKVDTDILLSHFFFEQPYISLNSESYMIHVVRKSSSLGFKTGVHSSLCYNDYLVRILSNRSFSAAQWIFFCFFWHQTCMHTSTFQATGKAFNMVKPLLLNPKEGDFLTTRVIFRLSPDKNMYINSANIFLPIYSKRYCSTNGRLKMFLSTVPTNRFVDNCLTNSKEVSPLQI